MIHWRLTGSDRLGRLHALTARREAVEPMSARLAAERAGSEERCACI